MRHLVWILGDEPTVGVIERARRLLDEFGSLGALLAASSGRKSKAVSGDCDALANLERCNDMINHVLWSRLPRGPLLSSCERMRDYLRGRLAYSPVEQFRVLYLDVGKRLIRDELLGTGTVDKVTVHSREIVGRAIELGATALIMVHNHPGGGLAPSEADRRLTNHIVKAADALDIEVIDHLIVSVEGMVSLRHLGVFP